MKVLKNILIIVVLLGSLFGCEEIFFKQNQINNPVNNFEYLWSNMSQRYSLFEFKNINWDSIYSVYRPQVDQSTPNDLLFDIMAEGQMVAESFDVVATAGGTRTATTFTFQVPGQGDKLNLQLQN